MWRAAAKLHNQWGDENGIRALAAYFATLEPKAAKDGNEDLVSAGRPSLRAADAHRGNQRTRSKPLPP